MLILMLNNRLVLSFSILCLLMSACKVDEPDSGSDDAGKPQNIIKVRDYGAVPNDGFCDIESIGKAVLAASGVKSPVLEFERGTYDLYVGDAARNVAISITGIDNLTIRGAVDRKQQPATLFLRHYDMAPNISATKILLVNDCYNLSVENLRFDNEPKYMASGIVTSNDGGTVGIRLLDGCEAPEESYMYCCNLWDPLTGDLKHVTSVTYGDDVDRNPSEYIARSAGAGSVMVTSDQIASNVSVGDGISWHFGWSGLQVDFRYCDNLKLSNIESNSAIGFHMQTSYCRNISASGVRIARKGSNYCVGSRDGWKMYMCTGNVDIRDMFCEGVRWDGQNVHGKFLYVKEVLNDYQLKLSFNGAPIERILPGDKMGVWMDRDIEVMLTVSQYDCSLDPSNKTCVVTFKEPLPDNLGVGHYLNVYSHICDYSLRNSEFRNIAGCASLIRNDNSEISGNTFYNIMYPAICVGGDLSNEGVTSKNVVIENNTIEQSAWVDRNKRKGAISVGVAPSSGLIQPFIRNVKIRNNSISGSDIGIHLNSVKDVTLEGNVFSSCGIDVKEE